MSESMDVEIILHEAKQFLDSHADFPALHNTIKVNGLGQRTKYEYIVDVNRKTESLTISAYLQTSRYFAWTSTRSRIGIQMAKK